MEFVRVTCLKERILLPPGDFEKNVLEEGESVILPKVLSDRIFREDLRARNFIKEELCEISEDRMKVYPPKVSAPKKKEVLSVEAKTSKDIVVTKPSDILDQNTVTVRKILKERKFSADDLGDLKKKEEKGKNRKIVLNTIKKLLKKRI